MQRIIWDQPYPSIYRYPYMVELAGAWPDAFYPPGYFEGGQGLSGTARLYGDVEHRGQGTNRNAGSFFGFVDTASQSVNIEDVTVPPPYAWRD